MPAVAWGTIRTVRTTVTSTTNATTASAINAAIRHLPPARLGAIGFRSCQLRRQHNCRRSVDLHDVDRRARGDDLVLVVGAGGPHLAADPHLAAAMADFRDGGGPPADKGGSAGLQRRRRPNVPAGNRTHDADQKEAARGEGPQLYGGRKPH